jgi:pyruvate dehydrogenase E2 component (dihydrolipoamide acetyltransferase)
MRFAGNFHPEWGYLAPAPNFMRTARIVIVATAIGATAGAAVVLSLAERSAPGAVADAGKTLVVVHSLVQPAEAAAPVAAATPAPVATAVPIAPAAPAKVQAGVQPQISVKSNLPANAPVARQPSAPPATASAQPIALPPAPSDSRAVSTSVAPASVAALSESPPVIEASPSPDTNNVVVAPVPLAAQKDAIKKPAATGQTLQQPQHGPAVAAAPRKKPEEHGLGPALRRLFSAN